MFEKFGKVFLNEGLYKYTSFGIGGPADILLFPKDENSLIEAIKIAKNEGIPITVLGNCTNVLIRDGGIRGLVIMLKNTFNEIKVKDNLISAEGGTTLKKVAQVAYENSLSNMEFAHGIPGSIGGAMIMNAGAYEGEMKDIVKSVRLLTKDFKIIEVNNEDMNFVYRNSRVLKNEEIVLSATFELKEDQKSFIKEKMEDFDHRRKSKQPLELRSCGSTFKRPKGYFAGKLIDDSGLRGFRYKNCGVSEKHCGFIVNYGGSSARDILRVIEIVKKVVFDNFGVELERELKVIGVD